MLLPFGRRVPVLIAMALMATACNQPDVQSNDLTPNPRTNLPAATPTIDFSDGFFLNSGCVQGALTASGVARVQAPSLEVTFRSATMAAFTTVAHRVEEAYCGDSPPSGEAESALLESLRRVEGVGNLEARTGSG